MITVSSQYTGVSLIRPSGNHIDGDNAGARPPENYT